jgi:FKBP-type peptidyl-prolyl cis-trans isomerase
MSGINSVNLFIQNDGHAYTSIDAKTAGFQMDPVKLLDTIEKILEKNLPYTPHDCRTQVAPEEARSQLQGIAKCAFENFQTEYASKYRFHYRDKEWPQVRRLIKVYLPSLPFPQELIEIIIKNLGFEALTNYSTVCLKANQECQVKVVFEKLAVANGYTYCNQNFSSTISHFNYVKTLSFFKEKVYETPLTSNNERLFEIQRAKALTFRHVFKWESAVTFQNSLDRSNYALSFTYIGNGKLYTLQERAVFCSFFRSRITAHTYRETFCLQRHEKQIKKAFAKAVVERQTVLNLQEAESYLMDISQRENLVEVERSKLFYLVKEQGNGQLISDPPLFHFNMNQWKDNQLQTIYSTYDNRGEPVRVDLEAAIVGFRKGVSGMTVGETRVIYVHPDLAFGLGNLDIAPNRLIIFEVHAAP